MITPYHAKYFANELCRRHSAADSEKLAGALLDAQVDLNPHQLEAALFAFKSPISKGAILADEVGLGKTIEAGLVLAQKWAEGKRRILIITPANLRKQWSQEMADKFFLPTIILEAKNYNQMRKNGVRQPFEQDSMVLCSYQFAAKHSEDLMTTRWDLVVMDEAHRLRNVYRPDNRIGNALKRSLANIPKILLTATPLQNSLLELYGLVSLIDEYAFGDVKSFRTQYSRLNGDGNFDELKARLKPICQRTLRRQVLEYIRYTNRIPITEEFVPSADETALYDMVSDYLRKPSLYALPNSQRQLMVLILRKLLASSTFAIAGALDSLANKLRKQLRDNSAKVDRLEAIEEDFEEFDEYAEEWGEEDSEPLTVDGIAAIEDEISSLESFRDLAVSISENAKGTALIKALAAGFDKARSLGAADKTIIFTESRRTQDYLVRLLSENGYADKLVLFNGSNNDSQSKAVYAQWVATHKGTDRVSGSKNADIRAALVDYFRDSAQIMIATEAAAEGINLQFCSMVVNYDLPWNPQRIEQRIGRCHRYGQKFDVVVINFLNKNNAADQRVYELLAEKFQLFSGVFGASDEVLGAIESGLDFEKRIVAIYQNCRTTDEIEAEFTSLRSEMDEQINATMEDTRKKLLENFDAEVHDRLRINLSESQSYLNKYETMLWAVTRHELKDCAEFDTKALRFKLLDQKHLGLSATVAPVGTYALTKGLESAHRFRLGHPLAQRILQKASTRDLPTAEIVFDYTNWQQNAVSLEPLLGKSGLLHVTKLSVSGADSQDHIILAGLLDDGTVLQEATIRRLFDLPAQVSQQNSEEITGANKERINTAAELHKSEILNQLALRQSQWFEEEMDKLESWADDMKSGLEFELKDLDRLIKTLKTESKKIPLLDAKLKAQKEIKGLEKKRNSKRQLLFQAQDEIESRKEGLIEDVESKLKQEVKTHELFTICWTMA
ncbi:MAG: DEAD/DEAH box helicase family protein [Chlorobium sp.]|nr:DEAD/DEAH box helicase family protein [Chlorobium sp.]